MNNWDPMNYLNEEPSPQCLLRVKKDIAEFNAQPPPRLFISPEESDVTQVHVLMLGAPGSPYEDGFFQFFLKFPPNYPLSPPRVRFLTTDGGRVSFHVHLYPGGKVCVTTLGTGGGLCDWSPAQSLSSTLISIQSLVGDNAYDCVRIQYETIRVAFLESYSKYEDAIKARLQTGSKLVYTLFKSSLISTAQYEKLLTRLQSLKEKVEKKKEAEAADAAAAAAAENEKEN
ncbi:ubiquitin-conjugating enzyme E2 Z [Rhipicephalus sanguineus]|uniref:ubiquitin-conjugating enzyme E2 Z n=1 Tax=Rhipicephalus sanguineus TaxID=34632 RepID=UPI00189315E8|nr:ubiquitin-conjugating enzyme E2 Z [Rhipicephalus sanguineus]